MKAKGNTSNQTNLKAPIGGKEEPEGYPSYPENDDIYIKYKENKEINPDDITKKNEYVARKRGSNLSADDLDIPGSELDDNQEDIGSEDEENNYYSLGGDDHNDLDEERE